MLDVVIKGGTVVDGTGAAGEPRRRRHPRRARSSRSATVTEPATRTIDATDQVVAPGFIDIHTHYDAQAFWDTSLSPSPLHGVTTVMGGNCGFTIAPLTPEDGDYLMRMLARVEGMPLESLQQGVPWDWRTTAEYLDRLDGTLMPNAGFMVGHSAIRRVVMKDAATERAATADELEQMKALLRDGLAAGGMGFSSTWSTSHNDHTGSPVPSRYASREEVLALCSSGQGLPGHDARVHPPGRARSPPETFDLMADMSVAANRPLNWNLLAVQSQNWEQVQHQLTGGDIAEAKGGRVLALTLPDTFRLRLNLRSGFVLDILPGWDKLMALPPAEKLAMLRDPAGRGRDGRPGAERPATSLQSLANWGNYTLLETFTVAVEAVRGPDHRRDRDDARQARPGTSLVRHRHRRRSEHRDRQHGLRPERCQLGEAGRGVARPAGHRRRVRRRRPSRHDRQLQLRHHADRAHDRRSLAAAARGGRALPHRRAGRAVRPHGPRRARRRATRPTSSCSTRRRSGPARCSPSSTCPVAPAACTARPTASTTCSSTACRASTAASCSTPAPARCCAAGATPQPSPRTDAEHPLAPGVRTPWAVVG